MRYSAVVDDREFLVEILDDRHVSVDGVVYEIDFESIHGQPVYSLLVDGRSFEGHIYPGEELWKVLMHGTLYSIKVEDEREKRLRAAAGSRVAEKSEFHLKAPMPGMVVAIPVTDGQLVEQGEVLVILESMKMQNELRAPRAGKVSRVKVKNGDNVDQNQTLLSVS
jgi:acetyl/propionyl-CoA carboxylase alpha subunit